MRPLFFFIGLLLCEVNGLQETATFSKITSSRYESSAASNTPAATTIECAILCLRDGNCKAVDVQGGDSVTGCYMLESVTETIGGDVVGWERKEVTVQGEAQEVSAQETAVDVITEAPTTTEAGVTPVENPCAGNSGANTRTLSHPDGRSKTVLCYDQYITILRRFNQQCVNFNRTWHEYKQGFGTAAAVSDSSNQFWLGNEIIVWLLAGSTYSLTVEIKRQDGQIYMTEYKYFSIGSEDQKYRLTVGPSSSADSDVDPLRDAAGEAIDNKPKFSTFDQDNDGNDLRHCAAHHGSGWWYTNCGQSNLNGLCPADQGYKCNQCVECKCMQWGDQSDNTLQPIIESRMMMAPA